MYTLIKKTRWIRYFVISFFFSLLSYFFSLSTRCDIWWFIKRCTIGKVNFLKSNFKVHRKNSIATFILQTDFFFSLKEYEKNTNKEDNVGEWYARFLLNKSSIIRIQTERINYFLFPFVSLYFKSIFRYSWTTIRKKREKKFKEENLTKQFSQLNHHPFEQSEITITRRINYALKQSDRF